MPCIFERRFRFLSPFPASTTVESNFVQKGARNPRNPKKRAESDKKEKKSRWKGKESALEGHCENRFMASDFRPAWALPRLTNARIPRFLRKTTFRSGFFVPHHTIVIWKRAKIKVKVNLSFSHFSSSAISFLPVVCEYCMFYYILMFYWNSSKLISIEILYLNETSIIT